MIPSNFRRLMGVSIPIISALAFLGIITTLANIELNESLVQTSITLSFILGLSQLWLWWLIYKRRLP